MPIASAVSHYDRFKPKFEKLDFPENREIDHQPFAKTPVSIVH